MRIALSLLCLAAAPMLLGAVAPNRPARIVSLNLCTDQLVLALADRAQIAGLSPYATDPSMSAAAAQARGLPNLSGSAEKVMAADPDLVVGMPATRHPATIGLKSGRYRALDLSSAESYAAVLASIRAVAGAVGYPARGEAMIVRMNADLAALPKARARGGRQPVAAYYQRRGFLTGAGTLVDEMIERAGMVNLARRLDRPALSHLSLEEMAAARPDYLIVESATDRVVDQGTEMLHHPAIANIPRISIPQAWTVCGGPAYVQAARAISKATAGR
jgi:iron complex transport system substrate-binding protein